MSDDPQKKFKIRIEYNCEPETKGSVRADTREQALAMVSPDPRYTVTNVVCEEIPWTQACLFSDDWDSRLVKPEEPLSAAPLPVSAPTQMVKVPKPKKRKETKADRVQNAAQAVLDAVEEAKAAVEEASKAYAAALEAYTEAQEALQGTIDSIEEALDNLKGTREDEYQGWYDNMPESLQQSPTGEKLSALLEIDLDQSMPELEELPEFEEPDFSDIENAAQEIMDAEYPLGYGKD